MIQGEFKNVTVSHLKSEEKTSAKGTPYFLYTLKLNGLPFNFSSYNLPKNITNENAEILSFDNFFKVYAGKEFVADIEIQFLPNTYNGKDVKKDAIVGIHIKPTF
jgi:hypothetical protein